MKLITKRMKQIRCLVLLPNIIQDKKVTCYKIGQKNAQMVSGTATQNSIVKQQFATSLILG